MSISLTLKLNPMLINGKENIDRKYYNNWITRTRHVLHLLVPRQDNCVLLGACSLGE